MSREQSKSMWLALEAEEGYEWYETSCEKEPIDYNPECIPVYDWLESEIDEYVRNK
jgi:hypothetical protein